MELTEGRDEAAPPARGWAAATVLCVGVWLHAADALMAATIMPTAVRDIGGLEYIYWTVALYELGSIVVGAATGLLAIRLGIRLGMVLAALLYGVGCVASALANAWPTGPSLLPMSKSMCAISLPSPDRPSPINIDMGVLLVAIRNGF